MHLCEGKFVVFQVDAENLLGIVNRGSAKLYINVVARELFWLYMRGAGHHTQRGMGPEGVELSSR